MTVEELRKALEDYPDDWEVICDGHDLEVRDIHIWDHTKTPGWAHIKSKGIVVL